MKTIKLALLFCLTNIIVLKSQNIGINGTGSNAHPSALLDVDDAGTNTKGLLIPRLALTAINVSTPVTAPATSLLVYNTANASTGINAVSPGYYYWDGTKWVRFAFNPSGLSAEAWTILGNGGTNATTNFLGTTDAQDLVFRTNNSEKMRVLSNGNVGIGTTAPAYRLQITNTDPNISITTLSQFNPLLTGNFAGNLHASWSAIQPNSNFNFTGSLYGAVNRVSVGASQSGSINGLYGSTNDISHLGIGTISSANGSIHYVSNQVGGIITSAKAAHFEVQNIGTGSITNAFGIDIGSVQGTNKWSVYASDAAAPSYFAGNIGIATTTPSEKLEVQGSVKIVDGTQGAGKVLTSDALGKASWKQPSGGYRQKYVLQSAQTYSSNISTLMNFPTIAIPYTGFYLLNFKSFFNVPIASEYSYYVYIYINGTLYSSDETYTYCDANFYLNQTDVYTLQANAGDLVTLYLRPVIGGVTIDALPATYTRVRFDLLFLGN